MKLRAREHLDLVLLGGLRDGPATGSELAASIRRSSGGSITLTAQTVHTALHRLRRNRMVSADTARRYRLTDAGQRSLRTREREWTDFVRAVDGVRGAGRSAGQSEPARSSSSFA